MTPGINKQTDERPEKQMGQFRKTMLVIQLRRRDDNHKVQKMFQEKIHTKAMVNTGRYIVDINFHRRSKKKVSSRLIPSCLKRHEWNCRSEWKSACGVERQRVRESLKSSTPPLFNLSELVGQSRYSHLLGRYLLAALAERGEAWIERRFVWIRLPICPSTRYHVVGLTPTHG